MRAILPYTKVPETDEIRSFTFKYIIYIHTFMQQGHFKCINSDSIDIYNVIKDLFHKIKMYHGFHKNIKQHNCCCFFLLIIRNVSSVY